MTDQELSLKDVLLLKKDIENLISDIPSKIRTKKEKQELIQKLNIEFDKTIEHLNKLRQSCKQLIKKL